MSNNTVAKPAAQSADSERMCAIIVNALEDAKGKQIEVLQVSKLTDITDFMIVSSGTSERHVKSLSNRVLEFMQAAGFNHHGLEGEDARDWVLIDFIDVVVHVMQQPTRKRYDLESLWHPTFAEMLPEHATADGKSERAF